jgi:hypothetical protein
MKKIKFIFFALLFSTIIYSCTDEDEDYQTNTIENIQATGDDTDVDNGSKD